MRFSDNPHAMRRAFIAVTFLAAALFYLTFVLRPAFVVHGVRYFTLVDDAMISMRYAQHIAAGAGPVWNVGQPPIEGFTNPAWVAWMAIVQGAAVPERMTSLVIVVALGMLTAVRLHTFGDWLPNTYYLKVNGVPFAVRIRGGLYRFFRFDIKDVAIAIAIVTIGFAWFPALWSRRHAWLAGLF